MYQVCVGGGELTAYITNFGMLAYSEVINREGAKPVWCWSSYFTWPLGENVCTYVPKCPITALRHYYSFYTENDPLSRVMQVPCIQYVTGVWEYLQVRRTAAGRCYSPVWWWMTASPRGCTPSPWKLNTWTHSPPLLERKGRDVR